MARPKSSLPAKQKLTLTVSAETRAELAFISGKKGKSISELVAEYAAKEAKKIYKKTGETPPDPEQISLEI